MSSFYIVVKESASSFRPLFRIGNITKSGQAFSTRAEAEERLELIKKTVQIRLAKV